VAAGGLAILAFALGHERLLSTSVDVAHHLQLAIVFRDALQLPPDGASFMAEMFVYPNIAHRLSGLLMRAGMDPLSAMTVLAAAATLTAWTLLLALAARVSLPAMLSTGLAAAALAAHWVGVFGREVVYNFFFAQLVGEAAALALACLVARLPRGLPFLLGATAATFLAGCVHLLPAIKLAGVFLVLLAIEALEAALRQRRRPRLTTLAGLALVPAALLLNPVFRAMMKISENDGVIDLGAPLGPAGVAVLAAALAGLSVLGLWRTSLATSAARPASRAGQLVFAFGLATAGAFFVQLLAWTLLGLSSPYAVLKHGFGVLSLLAACLPLVVAFVLPARIRDFGRGGPAWPRVLAPAALAALVGYVTLHRPSFLPVPQIAALLGQVEALRAANRLPNAQPIYFSASDQPPMVDYLASVVGLHALRDANVLAILLRDRPADLRQARFLAAPRADPQFSRPACQRGRPQGSLALYDGACLTGEWGPPPVLFRAGGTGAPYLAEGWSVPEAGGVWSQARRMRLVLPAPTGLADPAADARLEVVLFALLHERSPSRTATVRLEGQEKGVTHTFQLGALNEQVFPLPLPTELRSAPEIVVEIAVADPVTPRALGLGPDDRALGVGLKETRFVLSPRARAR
jgi:hypothetical protein